MLCRRSLIKRNVLQAKPEYDDVCLCQNTNIFLKLDNLEIKQVNHPNKINQLKTDLGLLFFFPSALTFSLIVIRFLVINAG